MSRRLLIWPCLAFLLFAFPELFAQCPAHAFQFLDVNNVNARLNNNTNLFWDRDDRYVYEVPKGSGKHAGSASSVWIGGLDEDDKLHMSASLWGTVGDDIYAGPHRSNGNYTCAKSFDLPIFPFEHAQFKLADDRIFLAYPNGFTVYDPVTDNASDHVLIQNRSNFRAVELANGQILIYGEEAINYPTPQPTMLVDPTSLVSQFGPTLGAFHFNATATVLNDGRLLLAGFFGCEIYDFTTFTSTIVDTMNMPRSGHTARLLPDGRVLVAGGVNTALAFGYSNSTEIFDPTTGSWSLGPTMQAERNTPGLTNLPSGEVLISGGAYNSGRLETFDPATNSLTPAGLLPDTFVDHTALLRPSGEVLLAHDIDGTQMGEIVVYDPVSQSFRGSFQKHSGYFAHPLPNGQVLVSQRDDPRRFLFFD
ncbi:MAG: kelch repeat-containing protein, partial [Bacteroidota bacterium]